MAAILKRERQAKAPAKKAKQKTKPTTKQKAQAPAKAKKAKQKPKATLTAKDKERLAKRAQAKQHKRANAIRRRDKSYASGNKKHYSDARVIKEAGQMDRLAGDADIWERMAEDSLYDMLREMGNSPDAITKYQRGRFLQSIMLLVIGLAMGIVFNQLPIVGGISAALALFLYYSKFSRIKGMYNQWQFNRELAFSRMVRLLIPYLKQSSGNVSLYVVFNKMLGRMTDESDRRSLYMLMGDMSSRPDDIQPFFDFAKRSSGSDMAFLIMSTIFDFEHSTQDTSVINELGQMASDQMMSAIDQIVMFKLRRFSLFPTKMVMSVMILVIGVAVGVAVHEIGGMLSGMSFSM